MDVDVGVRVGVGAAALLPERKGLGFVPRKRRSKAKVATARRLRWHCRSDGRDGKEVEATAAIAGEAAAVAKAIA